MAQPTIILSRDQRAQGAVVLGVTEAVAQVGSPAGDVGVLFSYPLPANGLNYDMDSLEFEAAGTFAGADGSELFVYLGSSAIFDSGAIHPGNESWVLRGRVIRTGPTSAVCYATLVCATLQSAKYTEFNTTFDHSVESTLQVKGEGVTLNDVLLNAVIVNFRGRS